MDTWLHISSMLGYPILALVGYIAFAAGRLTQRILQLEKRMERFETRMLKIYPDW